MKKINIIKRILRYIKIRKNYRKSPQRDSMTKEVFYEIYTDLQSKKKSNIFIRERNSMIILILYLFGLRINELREFTYEHWRELNENMVTNIMQPKTKSYRELVMTKKDLKVINLLKPHIPEIFKKENVCLLCNSKGKKLDNRHAIRLVNNILKPYAEKYKRNLKSHSFRIGFVTSMFRENIPLIVIQDIIGHKKLSTTLRYNRNITTREEKVKALSQIER